MEYFEQQVSGFGDDSKQLSPQDDLLGSVAMECQSVQDCEQKNSSIPPKKFIDGFDEATAEQKNSVRNFDSFGNKKKFPQKFFFIIIAVIFIALFFVVFKANYSTNFTDYDDSMVLVINQTKVSPHKIVIYIKTVLGVNEPTIKVADFLKEEFSQINIDKNNNVATWFWTLEGNRAKKAFNKPAKIRVTKANKYYEQEFNLDKEIRIEFHR